MVLGNIYWNCEVVEEEGTHEFCVDPFESNIVGLEEEAQHPN
jgi:hypothetical protein